MIRRQLAFFCCLLLVFLSLLAQDYSGNNSKLWSARDSLDEIALAFPSPMSSLKGKIVKVKNQKDWDYLEDSIKHLLREGEKTIDVRITARSLVYGKHNLSFENINAPDVQINIEGHNVAMLPWSDVYDKRSNDVAIKEKFYIVPYKNFNIDNIVLDHKGNEIPLYSEMMSVSSVIEDVGWAGNEVYHNPDSTIYKTLPKVWRFAVDLPDLTVDQCRDFYILLTRDWTACRHRVYKVEKGFLYFYLRSVDAPTLGQMTLNPNKDRQTHHKSPYYRYVNCPVSADLHFKNGYAYIPQKYNSVIICKASMLVELNNCKFKYFGISGFRINGGASSPVITMKNCSFKNGAYFQNNQFNNLSAQAYVAVNCENVCFSHNKIKDTRIGAISCFGCKNITIWANHLSRIGWMLSTRAVSARGVGIHIVGNTIEDFNYSAIECGTHRADNIKDPQQYIIERNVIRYTEEFRPQQLLPVLSDAGGIYICPQNSSGIIRYNVISDIIGKGANRGIFLDDGVKNVAVYGNLITNTDNCYDIDLRYCTTYASGIPDHNTNNQIFHNIMTGGYRFEDTGKDDSRCIGGENLLLGIGNFQKKVVKLKYSAPDFTLEGCKYKKGKVVIPKRYGALLDSLCIDSFVRNYILLR